MRCGSASELGEKCDGRVVANRLFPPDLVASRRHCGEEGMSARRPARPATRPPSPQECQILERGLQPVPRCRGIDVFAWNGDIQRRHPTSAGSHRRIGQPNCLSGCDLKLANPVVAAPLSDRNRMPAGHQRQPNRASSVVGTVNVDFGLAGGALQSEMSRPQRGLRGGCIQR